jgi:hypothetical protein
MLLLSSLLASDGNCGLEDARAIAHFDVLTPLGNAIALPDDLQLTGWADGGLSVTSVSGGPDLLDHVERRPDAADVLPAIHRTKLFPDIRRIWIADHRAELIVDLRGVASVPDPEADAELHARDKKDGTTANRFHAAPKYTGGIVRVCWRPRTSPLSGS